MKTFGATVGTFEARTHFSELIDCVHPALPCEAGSGWLDRPRLRRESKTLLSFVLEVPTTLAAFLPDEREPPAELARLKAAAQKAGVGLVAI